MARESIPWSPAEREVGGRANKLRKLRKKRKWRSAQLTQIMAQMAQMPRQKIPIGLANGFGLLGALMNRLNKYCLSYTTLRSVTGVNLAIT